MARHGGPEGKVFGTKKARLRCLFRHRKSSKRRRSSPAGDKLAKKGYIIAEADARSTTGARGEVVHFRRCGDGCQRDSLPFRGVLLALRRFGQCDTKHLWKRSWLTAGVRRIHSWLRAIPAWSRRLLRKGGGSKKMCRWSTPYQFNMQILKCKDNQGLCVCRIRQWCAKGCSIIPATSKWSKPSIEGRTKQCSS